MKKTGLSKYYLKLGFISFTLLCSACSFVELKKEANTVKILTADQVTECNSVGTVTTKVIDEILFISRNKETMATELETLARNEAIISKANAIVPITEIEEGRRSYKVYQCP